jgi:ubiquinone/menaquinone biosynthesis C-methylase UbiE
VEAYEKLARFYDLQHADLTADLIFYTYLARQAEGPVLEVGCGTGRLLLPLAESGIDVTGVDSSPAMLAVARDKLGQRVPLIEGDMRTVQLPDRYALIIISINTFMHLLTTSDQLAALTNLARYMAPGGQLVIDLPAGDELAHQDPNGRFTLEQTFVDPSSGRQVMKLVASRVDWFRQRQEITYVYEELCEDGQVERTVVPMTLRYIFRYELILLLEKAGYHPVSLFSDYDTSPYIDGGPRMIVLAGREEPVPGL